MPATTLRILIAIFLIAHGLVHMSLSNVPLPEPGGLHTPFWPSWWRQNVDPTWPAARLGLSADLVRTLGWVLWLLVMACFVIAGLGVLGFPLLNQVWQPVAVGASVLSLVLLGLYWHPWFVAGPVLDAAILIAIRASWPAALFPAHL